MSDRSLGIGCMDQFPMRMSRFGPVIGHNYCKVVVVFVGRVIIQICG